MSKYGEYIGELRRNWQLLLATSLGMSVGLQLFSYITSIFGPYLLKEFHWPREQFALIGLAMFSTLLTMPLAGRLTDRFGVRRMALAGVLLTPLPLLSYSLLQGPFWVFMATSVCQLTIGSLTGPVTYTRLIAARFERARGLALTIVMCAPALVGAILAPVVTRIIETFGWRIGYRSLAVFVLVVGLLAILIIPRQAGNAHAGHTGHGDVNSVRHVLGEIGRQKVFWVIFFAMTLCTLMTPLHGSQLNIMLREQHLTASTSALMLSVYALGTIIGRIASGLALDRFPARPVAAVSMILPAFGLLIIASPVDTTMAIGSGMFLIGMTIGAEGDLLSYLVSRYFRIDIFSTTLSLAYCAVFLGSASGALILSGLLKRFDSFTPFLLVCAATVAAGSLLFLLLPRQPAGTKEVRS